MKYYNNIPVEDRCVPVVVPPIQWHTETDPAELARCGATQWLPGHALGFDLRVAMGR